MTFGRFQKPYILMLALLALLTFGCTRTAEPEQGPTVTVTAKTDLRDMEPRVLDARAEWPEGPVTLHFRFSAPVDGNSFKTALQQAWSAAGGKPERSGLPRTWPATLEEFTWHIPDLPPRLEIDFASIASTQGDPVEGSLELRTKAVYHLGKVTLASPGSPEELAHVPPEVQWGALSPNGAHIALAHLTYADQQWAVHLSVLSRADGRRTELGESPYWDWLPDGRLLVYGPAPGSAPDMWSLYNPQANKATEMEARLPGVPTLSPDGKWVGALVTSEDRQGSLDLVVAQTEGTERRTFAAVSSATPAGPKSGDGLRWVAWAPDMTAIYTLVPTGAKTKPVALARVDLQTGAVTQVADQVTSYPESHRLFPSPDGQWLLVDATLIDLRDGSLHPLPEGVRVTEARWGSDSKQALIGHEDRVWVLDIDRDQATPLGAGVPLGIVGGDGFLAIWPEDLPRAGWRP